MTLTEALKRFRELSAVPEAPCTECGATLLGGWDRETEQAVSICLRCGRLEWDFQLFREPAPAPPLPLRVELLEGERISL